MAELVICEDCGEMHEDLDLKVKNNWFACSNCGSNNLRDEFGDSNITFYPKNKYIILKDHKTIVARKLNKE